MKIIHVQITPIMNPKIICEIPTLSFGSVEDGPTCEGGIVGSEPKVKWSDVSGCDAALALFA